MSHDEGEQLLHQVATWCKIASSLKALHKTNLERVIALYNLENAELLNELTYAENLVSEAESALRDYGMNLYTQTGSKKPAPGIGIRVTKVVRYAYNEALSWALEHKICLQLDSKAFEALAKTDQGYQIPAYMVEEPKVTLATDMTEWEDAESVEFVLARLGGE